MLELSKNKYNKIDNIIEEIKKEVKPTPEEFNVIAEYSNELVFRLKKIIPKDVEVLAVGSIAHNTQVRGSHDIDLFLLFPKRYHEDQMELLGVEYAKSIVDKSKNESYIIKYAEHPYVKLILKDLGITADIVPAFKINNADERITAVDRSQLHNIFINEHLTERQKDEVRVLKTFLKSHFIYGSDAKTSGFSGYLCELLVYTYGSLINLFSHFYTMKIPLAIIPLHRTVYEEGEAEELSKKFNSDFVVVDPIDENRNVAAVVSKEVLAKAIFFVRNFIDNPSKDVFYGKKFSDIYSKHKVLKFSKELGLSIFVVHFEVPEIAEDILWQQLRKLEDVITMKLKLYGFEPAMSVENVFENSGIIAFFINDININYAKIVGPSIFIRSAFNSFIKTHNRSFGFFFDKDKVVSIEKPKYYDAKEVIEESIKGMKLPSYLKHEKLSIYKNDIPENISKLVYSAFSLKTLL
ncbi:MAG: CCA tRNA nucleotidyltransferase [Candidatus Micrarchaeia archaeon]